VSDSRTPESDVNGRYLKEQLSAAGHNLAEARIIPDDPETLRSTLVELAGGPAEVILINGGTGISPRDTTIDVLNRIMEKTLPGFGEIFRYLSFKEIGSPAILSRATAGLFQGCVVFSMPGSPNAVRLAWEQLISREMRHLVYEIAKE
jgi:molybdenum cofactor biosynthesis protein B